MIVSPADRLKNVGEYYFSQKLEAIRKMRERGLDVISLGIGSPDLAPPPEAVAAATAAIADEKNHGYASYRSTPELRKSMSAWYQSTYGVAVDAETEILPLLGSKEGILYLSMALLNPGDGVLLPNPGYPAYSSVASLLGAKAHVYDLTEKSGWLPDLDLLEKQDLKGVKLMWVNYPHMPTGKVAERTFFDRLVKFAAKHRILVCNDNPYGLVLNTTPPMSLLSTDPEKKYTAELNSFSKSFNMAGWRVGMFLGAKELVDCVLQVKSNVDSGMFLAVQAGAAAAMKTSPKWHEARNAVYRERREIVWKIFDRLGFKYEKDQVGLFVWAKAPDAVKDVAQFLDRILEEANVFLTPGMIFGSNGLRYARASLCAPSGRLKEALQRIEGFKP